MPRTTSRTGSRSRSRSGSASGSRSRVAAAAVAAVATVLASLGAVPPSSAAAATPTVRWSGGSVSSGERVVATVEPGTLPARSQPVLQRRFPDAWRVADGTARRTSAGLRLTVPTDQYGRFTYRVAAVRSGDVVATSAAHRVLVRARYDPRGRPEQHQFLFDQRTRWDSCRPVRWKFNADLAPRRGLAQVKAAVRRIHAATGLEFDYRGRSDRRADPYGDHATGAAVLIGWRSARTFVRRTGSPQVVGLAGQRFFSGYRDADGAANRTTQAGVMLNAGHRLAPGFGRGTTWGEVIVHELGHVVGLDHAAASSQIMYYSTTEHDAHLAAGDLAGMRQLGDTRGCLRRVAGRVTAGSALSR